METKIKVNKITKNDEGITLVALIITIIILVILSAVSIGVIYKSKIVDYAIEGAQKYAIEGINENRVMEGTEELIESAISTIKEMGITGGESPNPNPDPELEEGKTAEELGKVENIGKYIDYKSAGSDYTVNGTYSGTGSNQTFAKNDDMKWRIWRVEENKLLLISETLAGNIQLSGIEGYNNGVKILNDACAQAFGNSNYGSAINVRSINQDDIDKVTNMTTDEQRKAVYSNYGTIATPSNKNYPYIYAEELDDILDRSSQDNWYSGTKSILFTGKYTHYNYSITSYAMQTIYDELLTNMSTSSGSGVDSHTAYWIASRCIRFDSSGTGFHLFRLNGGNVDVNLLYYAPGTIKVPTNAVRPIVEVNLDLVSIGKTGSGTNTDSYSMTLK